MKLLLIRYKVIIAITVLSVLYLFTLDNYWKPFWDSAIYISLAKSLAAGTGYNYMGLPHAKYPFMFPLLLSPIIGLFGLNFLLMRLLIIILTIVSLFLTYILFRKLTDEETAFALMILTGFSSALLHLTTWILSEVPYFFLSLCTLYFFLRYDKEDYWLTTSGLLSSVFLVLTCFTRMIGVTLLIAFLLHVLTGGSVTRHRLRSSRKVLLVFVIACIPLSLWFYRGNLISKQFPFQPEYRGVLNYQKEFFQKVPDNIHSPSVSLAEFAQRIADNTSVYAGTIADVLVTKAPFRQLRVIALLLFLYGFIWCVVERRTVIEWYVALYGAVCLIWWFNEQSIRFIVPVIPFVFYYFLTGFRWSLVLLFKALRRVPHNWSEKAGSLIFRAALLLLVFTNFSFNPGVIKSERRKHFYPPELVVEFDSAVNWITGKTAQNTVIMTSEAPWVFMRSDRKTLTFPLFEPIEYIINSIIKHRVEYLLVSTIHYDTYGLMQSLAEEHPEAFIQVFNNNKTFVYKIDLKALAVLRDDLDKHLR